MHNNGIQWLILRETRNNLSDKEFEMIIIDN